jgi:hypothetical protein
MLLRKFSTPDALGADWAVAPAPTFFEEFDRSARVMFRV